MLLKIRHFLFKAILKSMFSEYIPEKRRHPRYIAGNRALIRVDSVSDVPFHLVDISQGGLAFRYLGEKKEKEKITSISLGDDEHIFLEKIQVSPIADINISPQSINDRGGMAVPRRRVSLQFTNLTPEQESGLETFIRDHTVGIA